MELPSGYRLTVEREPSIEDRRALGDALGTYNEPFLPNGDPQSLAVLVRTHDGELRAGLDGFTYAGWLFTRYLWVHAELRRSGIGRRLMAEAERHARELGCHSAWVDTFTFQAPDFYAQARLSRVRPARIPARPPTHFLAETIACGVSFK